MRRVVRSSLSLSGGGGPRLPPGPYPARAGSRLPLLLGLASLRSYASLAQASRVDGRSRDVPDNLFGADGGAGMRQPRSRSASAPRPKPVFEPIQRIDSFSDRPQSMAKLKNRAARRAHLQTEEARNLGRISPRKNQKSWGAREVPREASKTKNGNKKKQRHADAAANAAEAAAERATNDFTLQAESLAPAESLVNVVESLRKKFPSLPRDLEQAEETMNIIRQRLKDGNWRRAGVLTRRVRIPGARKSRWDATLTMNGISVTVSSSIFEDAAYQNQNTRAILDPIVKQELAARMLGALDAKNLIEPLLASVVDSVNEKQASKEQSAMLDVFEYCTRHLLMPKITVEPVANRTKFTIQLEEQGIHVAGIHPSPSLAEIAAAIKFKAAAEAYQLRLASTDQSDTAAAATGAVPEPLVVRDQRGLSIQNAQKFHRWMTFNQPGKYEAEVETTKAKVGKDFVFFSQCRVKTSSTPKDAKNPSDTRADQGKASGQVPTTLEANQNSSGWLPIGPKIPSGRRVASQQLAHLAGALAMVQETPSLAHQFAEALRAGNGEILIRHRSLDASIQPDSIRYLKWATEEAFAYGLPKGEILPPTIDHGGLQDLRRSRPTPLVGDEARRLSASLAEMHERYLASDGLAEMRRIKSELPMNQYKDQVYRLVQDNVFSIIVGATGSGKTTQVPQIILEQYYRENKGAECEIICTQPRRIAAVSVAGRVKDEMGPELRSRVGHHVRFDSQLPQRGGSVTFATTGILLLQLQHDPDSIMDHVSHLLIDEVHERDKVIDFTLTMIKNIVTSRQDRGLKVPRITLMSATLDTELFSNYFQNESEDGATTAAPILSVPGRTFPVAERYLDEVVKELRDTNDGNLPSFIRNDKKTELFLESELAFQQRARRTAAMDGQDQSSTNIKKQDSAVESIIDWRTRQTVGSGSEPEDPSSRITPTALVAGTIAHLARTTTEGAILVFMAGLEELQSVEGLLTAGPVLGVDLSGRQTSKYRLYLLHSSIPDTQKTVFETAPPGIRKIILSTNIAETSVTIPDVQYVIDTGKSRELQYDHIKRISALTTAWISKSNTKQRAGRAGRVQAGYYLALFSKERHRSMRAIGLPELLRTDLQATCLDIRSSLNSVNVRDFLGTAIEPPDATKVDHAMTSLVGLGALDQSENLTALGRLLSRLPIHPGLGKMVVLGLLFRCLDPILVIGAAAEERNLFIMAPAIRKQALASKHLFMGDTRSDHLAMYSAFQAVRSRYLARGSGTFTNTAMQFAMQNSVHIGAFKSIFSSAKQMSEVLQDHGLIPRMEATGASGGSTLFGGSFLNQFSANPEVIKAVLTSGLQPNFASPSNSRQHTFWRTADMSRLMVPSGSVALKAESEERERLRRGRHLTHSGPFPDVAVFSNLVKALDGNTTFISEISVLDPIIAILCADKVSTAHPGVCLQVNGWMPIYMDAGPEPRWEVARVLLRFREVLEKVKAGAYADLATGKPLHEGRGSTASIRYLISEVVANVANWSKGGEMNAREMLDGRWLEAWRQQLEVDRMTRRQAYEKSPSAMRGSGARDGRLDQSSGGFVNRYDRNASSGSGSQGKGAEWTPNGVARAWDSRRERTNPAHPTSSSSSSRGPAVDNLQDAWKSWQQGQGSNSMSYGRGSSSYGNDGAYSQGYGQHRQDDYPSRRSSSGEGWSARQSEPTGGYAPRSRPTDGYTPRLPPTDGYAPRSPPTEGYAPRSRSTDGYAPRSRSTNGYAPRSPPTDGYAPRSPPTEGYAPRSRSTDGYTPRSPPTDGYAPRSPPTGGYAPRSRSTDGYQRRSGPQDGQRDRGFGSRDSW